MPDGANPLLIADQWLSKFTEYRDAYFLTRRSKDAIENDRAAISIGLLRAELKRLSELASVQAEIMGIDATPILNLTGRIDHASDADWDNAWATVRLMKILAGQTDATKNAATAANAASSEKQSDEPPTDPKGFVTATEIIKKHASGFEPALNYDKLRRLLDENRDIRTRKPSPRRSEVYLPDWLKYCKQRTAKSDGNSFDDVDAYIADVESRKAEARARKALMQ
jgi:hypothetical protein